MNTWIASLLGLTSLALAPAATAKAQCTPGAFFCAEVSIGAAFQPAPPVVYVQPAPPPVVYVQPPPPPPRVIYVQPVPQPVVVHQPVMVGTYQATVAPAAPQRERPGFGVRGFLAGSLTDEAPMGGLGAALRLGNPTDRYAVEFGIAAYAGTDYNGLDRVEVPLTADILVFLNPNDPVRLYGLGGVGLSFANAQARDALFDAGRNYVHVGAEVGVGVELMLSPYLALNFDMRGFVRQRVDSDERPEFTEAGTGRTTNTSAGSVGTLGATVYF